MKKSDPVSPSFPPLRIGLVTPAWPGSRTANGISTSVAHLATGLKSCGHEVTIIPFTIDALHDLSRIVKLPDQRWSLFDRLRVRFCPNPEITFHHKVGQQIAAAVQTAISRHGIEILVMEESYGWAASVCRTGLIPVVVTLHGPWCLHKEVQGLGDNGSDALREALELRALRMVQGITSPSRDVLERTAALWQLPDVPKAVIHNPTPVMPAMIDFDRERLLFVGRFDFHKGGDVVIQAFTEIARRHPTCRLTFVGPDSGVERPGLTPLSLPEALSGLSEAVQARIDVRGHCSREEVSSLRRTHGLTIVASRYENFGGTIVEAMAAGSALVCTNVGGGAEILSHEETALLVPPDDPQALAMACLRILEDPDLAHRMGMAARAYVERHLSPNEIAQQMTNFLTPLCRARVT